MATIVKSAARAMEIMEYLCKIGRPASASEVQDAIGLPQSSTSMLLRTLVVMGYLEYMPSTRHYRPTFRIALVGNWLCHQLPRTSLLERLTALQAETQGTVTVGRRSGACVQFIFVLGPGKDGRASTSKSAVPLHLNWLGDRPMAGSTSGRALLSIEPAATARRIIRQNNAYATDPRECFDEEMIMKSLPEIRRSGLSETTPDMVDAEDYHAIVALALAGDKDAESMTIGVLGNHSIIHQKRDQIINALRDCVKL